MKPMARTNSNRPKMVLSTDEVLRIIQTCAASGAIELKFNGLEIKFGAGKPEPAPSPGESPSQTVQVPAVAEMTEIQHTEQTKKAVEKDELLLREQQMAELMITDPLEYERQVNQGELEDDTDESADDDQPE